VDDAPAGDASPVKDGARADGVVPAADDDAPVDDALTDDAHNFPADDTLTDAHGNGAPMDGALTDASEDRVPEDGAPVDGAPAGGAPADGALGSGAPAVGVPADDDAPTNAPAQHVPYDDGPAENEAKTASPAPMEAPPPDYSPALMEEPPANPSPSPMEAPAVNPAPAPMEAPDLALEAPAPILDLSEAPAPPPAVEKVDDSDPYHGSLRVMWSDKHGSYFEGIGHGVYHAGHSEEESAEGAADTKELKYSDGFVITHDGKQVCEIERRLGQGAMGTVYLGKLPDGSRCAVKALREDKVGAERITMEKELAVETSIGIALARHPLIASAIGAVVPLPGVETTAKGLLLLCDLVDAGDLEEAMSTKAAVAKLSPDYAGTLWDDERWTLMSIMIQMFHGFEHIHKRGIIHQVRSRAAPPRGKLLEEILSSC